MGRPAASREHLQRLTAAQTVLPTKSGDPLTGVPIPLAAGKLAPAISYFKAESHGRATLVLPRLE